MLLRASVPSSRTLKFLLLNDEWLLVSSSSVLQKEMASHEAQHCGTMFNIDVLFEKMMPQISIKPLNLISVSQEDSCEDM